MTTPLFTRRIRPIVVEALQDARTIVVSNDADLKTPIEIAKTELGVSVGVLNPHPLKRRSFDLQPTFFKQLRRGPIAASQFPRVLKDTQGKIRKPPSW
jgi:hypothetical protein